MMNAEVRRKKELALIHMAKSDLGMSREDYEFVLVEVTGKTSAAKLNGPEREKLIKHFKTKGFQIKSNSTAQKYKAHLGYEGLKVLALWRMLHELGAVKNPSEEALQAYIKRITKMDAVRWVNGPQAETLIETLKKWAMRYLPDQVKAMAQDLALKIKVGDIELDVDALHKVGNYVGQAQIRKTFEPMWDAYELLKSHGMRPTVQEQVK